MALCPDELRLKQISDLLATGIGDVAPDYADELRCKRDSILNRINNVSLPETI